MSVYSKLTEARVRLHAMDLKKSGENKFAGFKYFELGDFIPQVQSIFKDMKLCGFVSFTPELATLQIVDTEDASMLCIYSPMAMATLKGAHDVQNMGATQTYLRRYLWTAAMELTESDWVDAVTGKVEQSAPVKAAPVAQKPAKVESKELPKQLSGKGGDWNLTLTTNPDADPEQWLKDVLEINQITLDLASNSMDVMTIFRVNRGVYDSVKAISEDAYKNILAQFSTAKSKYANKEES